MRLRTSSSPLSRVNSSELGGLWSDLYMNEESSLFLSTIYGTKNKIKQYLEMLKSDSMITSIESQDEEEKGEDWSEISLDDLKRKIREDLPLFFEFGGKESKKILAALDLVYTKDDLIDFLERLDDIRASATKAFNKFNENIAFSYSH